MTDARLEAAMEELRGITGRRPHTDMVSAMQEMLAALQPDATTRFHDYSDEGGDCVLGFIHRKHTMACFTIYDDGAVRASVCYNGHCVKPVLTTARAIEMMLAPNTEHYGSVIVVPVDGGVRVEYLSNQVTLKPAENFLLTEKINIVCMKETEKP